MTPNHKLRLQVEAARIYLAEHSLYEFTKQAWPYVDPNPFVPNWHLEAICNHLEAVTRGQIRRLLINIPPRCTKSILVGVMWPCWSWIIRPETKWMFATYAQALTIRDSLKCRYLIGSDWYQTRWGHRFKLRSDQNQKQRYDNDQLGFRLSTTVGGMATGEGGDFLIFDDPHNVLEAESDAVRQSVIDWWGQSMSTRGNDPKTVARVGVMQRVHEMDLAAYFLEEDPDNTVHLCLPMEYDPETPCSTSLGFTDPRSMEGDLLWPARFDRDSVTTLKRSLGPYGTASQLQQRPAPKGGGIFRREFFKIVGTYPRNVKHVVRYWDKAGTASEGDYTSGVLMAETAEAFYVVDVVRGQWSYREREKIIKQTAVLDDERFGGRRKVEVHIEQEPGSGGKESAERTVRLLAGHPAKFAPVTGDKETRAAGFAAQCEVGNVRLVASQDTEGSPSWNRAYLDELCLFPFGKHDDQVDASSGAFNALTKPRKRLIVA